MFWNKKAEVDGLPITLSLRTAQTTERMGRWEHKIVIQRFLAYKTGDTWKGVVGYNEYKKKTDLLEAKLDLILDHLKLKYVPETETKEPAKLVEVEEIEKVYLGFPLGYVDRPISKKGRPKKK